MDRIIYHNMRADMYQKYDRYIVRGLAVHSFLLPFGFLWKGV